MISYRVLAAGSDEFPGWVGIACMVGDRVVSVSWAPPEVPVGARLNMDYPTAYDERSGQTVAWEFPGAAMVEWLGLTDADMAQIRDAAEAKGLM